MYAWGQGVGGDGQSAEDTRPTVMQVISATRAWSASWPPATMEQGATNNSRSIGNTGLSWLSLCAAMTLKVPKVGDSSACCLQRCKGFGPAPQMAILGPLGARAMSPRPHGCIFWSTGECFWAWTAVGSAK
jgi:hypothetical protein